MAPVRVPIVDYENPFYCPAPLQLRSADVCNTGSDIAPYITPCSRNSTTTKLAYDHEGVKNDRHFNTRTSSPSIYALVHRRNHVTNDGFVAGRKFANISHNSSPCARLPSYLVGRGQNPKRTRYTRPEKELTSFAIPDGKREEPFRIKQEYISPVLSPLPGHDKQSRPVAKEGHKNMPASALGYRMDDTVTTRTLLLRLDEFFPRIGFREAANSVQHVWPETNAEYRSERHQALVDLLGKKGALNECVLTALHDAEFHRLDLGPTMSGINELHLPRGDVMRALNQPGWFKKLKILSFAGGRIQDDFALAHIRPLRQIETLVLTNTCIGNEGVFHIIALKHNLRHLDLTGNPSINDDSILALVLLENLEYLSLFGTGVQMPGLRKLAMAMKEGERVIDVRIPSGCNDYINGMHKQYLLYPVPPLVSDPGVIGTLSKSALSRNLEAHAAINSTIIATGPCNEMEERLRKILEARNLDLVAREMLVGRDEAR